MKTKYAQWLNLRKISIIESDSQIFNYETPCNSLDQNPARDQKTYRPEVALISLIIHKV